MEAIISYSTSELYAKYLCVSVTSLLKHSSSENTYRIIVLDDAICDKTKELIRNTGAGYDNVTFEFINAKKIVPQNLYTKRISVSTYYDLALMDLFPDIDKILCLDCDTIVMADVAELFKLDLTGYYFAAVRDLEMIYNFGNKNSQYKVYAKDVLKLNNTADYVNAGVVLFNFPEFRKDYNSKKLIDIAMSHSYKFFDQDVLNSVAEGKIYFLHPGWNFFGSDLFLTEKGKEEYKKASENIAILHFAGKKPWEYVPRGYASYFWKYALESVSSEYVWNDFAKYIDYRINDIGLNERRVLEGVYEGKIDFKFYLRLVKAVVIGTFRKIKGKFER